MSMRRSGLTVTKAMASRGFARGHTGGVSSRDLLRYAHPFFGERRHWWAIAPRDISALDQLALRRRGAGQASGCGESPAHGDGQAPSPLRRIGEENRGASAGLPRTARREGRIRSNPCDGAPIPHRPQIQDGEQEKARALTREQLGMFLRIVHPAGELFFRTLAATGLRWSEIRRRSGGRIVQLDGSSPHIRGAEGALQAAAEGWKAGI